MQRTEFIGRLTAFLAAWGQEVCWKDGGLCKPFVSDGLKKYWIKAIAVVI